MNPASSHSSDTASLSRVPTVSWGWWRVSPFLLFLVSFLFLLVCLNPTFYLDDSAETSTSAYLMGIPHPPGYPLHTALGRLFTFIGCGIPAFRINLLAAVLAALTCVVLARIVRRHLEVPSSIAWVLGLLWTLGATIYPSALSAKGGVYQLSALLLALILAALLSGNLRLGAFLWGLSLTNHWMSMAAFTPGLLVLAHACRRREDWNPRELWASIALALCGFSTYLILPIRAMADPSVNWGDPRTFSNFLFNFSRAQYRGAEATGGAMAWGKQAWFFLKGSFLEFPGLLIPAGLGLGAMAKAWPRRALGLGLIWILLGLSISIYLDLTSDRYYLMNSYAIPTHVVVLLLVGAAIGWTLKRNPGNRGVWRAAILTFFCILALLLGLMRFRNDRQTHYTYDYDYATNVFQCSPRDAILYCKGDGLVFPTWYFQYVEKKRLDIAAVGVDGLPMSWVRKHLVREHPGLKVPMPTWKVGLESIATMQRVIAADNRDRPLCLSYNRIMDNSLPEARLLPYGIVSRAIFPPDTVNFNEGLAIYHWAIMRIRNIQTGNVDKRTREQLMKDYAINRNTLGVFYEDTADMLKTRKPGQTPATSEMLSTLYTRCLEHYKWSLQFFPDDGQFAFNVGNANYHLGRKQEALVWYRKAVGLLPDFTDAYFNWAVAAFEEHDYNSAAKLFQKVLEMDPERQAAKDGLKYLKDIKFIQEPGNPLENQ